MRFKWIAIPVVVLSASCGGGSAPPTGGTGGSGGGGGGGGGTGGSTVITSSNYLDAAAVAYIAATRLEFANDLIDAAFETVVNTLDTPGTYPCLYGGTVSYARSGSVYTFTVSNCDTVVGGDRRLMPSGSMTVSSPVVQTTSVGYFLTSAAVALAGAAAVESGVVSVGTGSANLSSTVTSETTATGTTSGASLAILRAGQTDSYTEINVTSHVDIVTGNTLTAGSFKISSPRAPGALTVTATSPSLTATALDNSQAVLTTTNGVDYTVQLVVGGVVQATTVTTTRSGPFADAIARALR